MSHKNIAIFGSTGHIAKNIISFFSKDNNYSLFLFSRDPKKFQSLDLFLSNNLSLNSYKDFEKNEYDVIINCIGENTPGRLSKIQFSVLETVEFYDNMIINYLKNSPTTLYINLSSGAVFGQEFDKPVDDLSISKLSVNKIGIGEIYSISKIYLESKHRALPDMNIVDLRIFGFFSRFIDLNTIFFMSELIKATKNKSTFVTHKENIMRDYVNPSDFYDLIKNCISNKKLNDEFDVFSKEHVSKFQILQEFSNQFDLKFRLIEQSESISITGLKKNYYSLSRKAEKIGYLPQFSSLETILNESILLLENH